MKADGPRPARGGASEAARPAVVAALVENHRRFLVFLERRVGSRADAEELLQATFVRGLERAGEVRDEERAVAWFYRMLRNALVDHWRARGAESRASEALARELADAHEPAPELAPEICGCFEPLLAALKPEYAEILRRVDLEGVRPLDFAAEAGMTPNNAMVRLHRARQSLREQLQASCRTCADHGCLDCSCGRPKARSAGGAGEEKLPQKGPAGEASRARWGGGGLGGGSIRTAASRDGKRTGGGPPFSLELF